MSLNFLAYTCVPLVSLLLIYIADNKVTKNNMKNMLPINSNEKFNLDYYSSNR